MAYSLPECRVFVASLAAATFLTAPSAAENADAVSIPVETINLGGGVHALITGRGGNVGVLVGEDGVFMIDTQFPDVAEALDGAQKAVSGGQDVDIVLNTHLHGDHVLGNGYFADRGAVIMAHPNVRPALTDPATSQLTGRTPDALSGRFLPTLSVNHGDMVTMNGQTALFYHTPTAHTDGDIFVHFQPADVIHAGDLLFSGMFPYIDLDNGGTVEGMIAGMQMIVDVAGPDTQIIAGHGPVSTEADVQASIDMLTEGRARVAALVEDGMDLEAVQAAEPLADFHSDWNWQFITTERMVWTFYRDITGKVE